MAEQAIRKYWSGIRGRTALNINWDAVGADSTVQVTASEYAVNDADPRAAQRFVGAASIVVRNVTPHGPPYDTNRGVTFVVDVQWPHPLNIVTDVAVLSAPEASQPPVQRWRRVNIPVQRQQQTNWCWAAVAVSIADFYGAAPTQCAFVNTRLGRTDCCGAGAAGPCNQTHSGRDAIDALGHLADWDASRPGQALIRAEIDANRPMAVRVEWAGGGAHLLVVDGYLENFDFVAVDDPWFGTADIALSTLHSAYQGTGSVTHHYLTQ